MDYCTPQSMSSNFNLEIHIDIWADSVRRNLQFGTFYNLLFIWTLNNEQILRLVIILVRHVLTVTLCGPSCS